MKDKEYAKISDLKKRLSEVINEIDVDQLPETLIYNPGFGFAKYKITINEIQEDFMVDSKGVKWMRVKE